jgi:hypothetical protein
MSQAELLLDRQGADLKAIFSANEYPIVSPYDSFEAATILMQAIRDDKAHLQELCDLSNQIELLEADRIQQLTQLAQMRSTSIEDLIKQLNLISVNHG